MEKETVFIGIDDYMALYSPYIKRAEARDLAQCYVVGLMMDGDRKSVEPMSEKVHASEGGMQRLLTEVKWDRDGAFGEYRRRMLAETADPRRHLRGYTGFSGVSGFCSTRSPGKKERKKEKNPEAHRDESLACQALRTRKMYR